MKKIPLLLALALIFGCQGTRPKHFGPSSLGFGAILIRAKLILPDGETRRGNIQINIEADSDRYRLKAVPDITSLYRVEPDVYRLAPTRSLFGMIQPKLKVSMGGKVYRIPFPRSILRKAAIEVKPRKIVPIGVIEARLLPIEDGARPKVEVRLNDSTDTRRKLVEDLIHREMDHRTPLDVRDNLISWNRALEQALLKIQGEETQKPSYKSAEE